jgi:hypothetical protein
VSSPQYALENFEGPAKVGLADLLEFVILMNAFTFVNFRDIHNQRLYILVKF